MNAITSFSSDDETRISSAEDIAALEQVAHVFRSQLIEKFAEIETAIIKKVQKAEPAIIGKKPLGLKFDIVRKLVIQNPPIFKNPSKVGKLLDQLQPFADLRAELAHSTITILSTAQKGDIVVYRNANEANHAVVQKCGHLTTGQMKHFLKRTAHLCAEFKLIEVEK